MLLYFELIMVYLLDLSNCLSKFNMNFFLNDMELGSGLKA